MMEMRGLTPPVSYRPSIDQAGPGECYTLELRHTIHHNLSQSSQSTVFMDISLSMLSLVVRTQLDVWRGHWETLPRWGYTGTHVGGMVPGL